MIPSLKYALTALALCACTLTPANALDSDQASGRAATAMMAVEDAAEFSKQIEQSLAARGARLAMVFRSGRDRSDLPDGISYTHGAFWVYQPIQKADGTTIRGYAVYNLYHGDGETLPRTKSFLEQDFPLDFTVGSTVDDVGVILLTPEMEQKVLRVMASPTYAAMHVPDYSLISNAGDARYQNCNEFMLDVIAAALWETDDYAQIKANLATHFEPTKIDAGLLKRLFAPVVDERLKTSDHEGRIETVSYGSLANFLISNGYARERLTITFDRSRSAIAGG